MLPRPHERTGQHQIDGRDELFQPTRRASEAFFTLRRQRSRAVVRPLRSDRRRRLSHGEPGTDPWQPDCAWSAPRARSGEVQPSARESRRAATRRLRAAASAPGLPAHGGGGPARGPSRRTDRPAAPDRASNSTAAVVGPQDLAGRRRDQDGHRQHFDKRPDLCLDECQREAGAVQWCRWHAPAAYVRLRRPPVYARRPVRKHTISAPSSRLYEDLAETGWRRFDSNVAIS